jgi:hypothetical protein
VQRSKTVQTHKQTKRPAQLALHSICGYCLRFVHSCISQMEDSGGGLRGGMCMMHVRHQKGSVPVCYHIHDNDIPNDYACLFAFTKKRSTSRIKAVQASAQRAKPTRKRLTMPASTPPTATVFARWSPLSQRVYCVSAIATTTDGKLAA